MADGVNPKMDKDAGFSGLAQFALMVNLFPLILSAGFIEITLPTVSPIIFDLALSQHGQVSGPVVQVPLVDNGTTFLVFLFELALLPFVLFTCIRRRLWGWMLFSMPIHLALFSYIVMLLVAENPAAGIPSFEAVYGAASKLGVAWLAYRGRILSKSYLFFAAVAASPLIGAAPDTGFIVRSNAFFAFLAFTMLVLLVRLIIFALLENLQLFRQLGPFRTIGMLAWAAVLWLPMLALAAPYFILTEKLREAAVEAAYENPRMVKYDITHPDLRTDVLVSVAILFLDWNNEWTDRNEELKRQIRDFGTSDLSARFAKEFDEVVDSRMTFAPREKDPDYWWGWVTDKAVDVSQDITNEGYMGIRAKIRERLIAKVKSYEPLIVQGTVRAEEVVNIVEQDVSRIIRETNHAAQLTIWWTFVYLHALHMLGHILFGFVCVKSFMYVLGRVILSRNVGTTMTLGDPDRVGSDETGAIMPRGSSFVLSDEPPGTYYFARRFRPRGRPPRFSIPQPLGAPIARLLHGATALNRIDLGPGGEKVFFNATSGAEFVEWRLAPGETIVFDFHHFVGMAATVKVSTLISLRLATLIMGKFIFSTATGPGIILLKTAGAPEFGRASGEAASLPPERLVAFHRDTPFHVDSELGVVDVYLSTAYVRPVGTSSLIMDVDREEGASTGLSRFLLHFIWPG